MKILVINCGSSSIKYKLYEMDDQSVLAAGGIEKIGLEGSFLKTKINGETKIIDSPCPTHTEGIRLMFDTLLHPEYGAIKSLDEISAAGHRIVAGGRFTRSQVVTDAMLEEWKQYMELAPLHSEAQGLRRRQADAASAAPGLRLRHRLPPDHAGPCLHVRRAL